MKKPASPRCPTETALAVIGGRWKVLVIWELARGAKRYGELRRALVGVTPKMLTQQLREMERDGIVARTAYPEVPPRVEYALTPLGETLRPVLEALDAWGRRFLRRGGEVARAGA
jgi:DNA-binding HxlR family transcriptional regulator